MAVEHIKAEILAWQNALGANDAGDFRGSLHLFEVWTITYDELTTITWYPLGNCRHVKDFRQCGTHSRPAG
jgi:hypothetical protein